MRDVHKDFRKQLLFKDESIIELYIHLRNYILSLYPRVNELLYHTHALTSLYSVSPKMSDGFCMIVIYERHINLAFNKGTLLDDPSNLLKGSGKLMRHIRIDDFESFDKKEISKLIIGAYALALEDSTATDLNQGLTISKIKN